jgi:hypothetical protein
VIGAVDNEKKLLDGSGRGGYIVVRMLVGKSGFDVVMISGLRGFSSAPRLGVV